MISRAHPKILAAAAFCALFLNVPGKLLSQTDGVAVAEFKSLSAQLSASRLDGTVESRAQQDKALTILDTVALTGLNASAPPDLDATNLKLTSLVSHALPVGENYHLVKLNGTPSVFALIANFGLGGPAAVRIYAAKERQYSLAASIDHFADKDFFDSDIEVVPVAATEPVFVIVSGRTDDLSTGLFSAWRFDGRKVISLWTSEPLTQSAYEATPKGFLLTACVQPDEEHPARCIRKTRDLYGFQGGEWKKIETSDLGPTNGPAR